MFVSDLPTPAVLVERSRLESNLDRMARTAAERNVLLRPHAKTHKSIRLGRLQLEAGAAGLTVAKPAEAGVFVAAGFRDVRIAYPVATRQHFEEIASLLPSARVSFCLDTRQAADAASAFFVERGLQPEVLVEIDCDYGRSGIPWNDPGLVEFVRYVSGLPGLRLTGILSHAGQSYAGPAGPHETPEDSIRRVSAEEVARMLDVAVRLQAGGVPGARPGAFEISVGSTPAMRFFENRRREGFAVSEVRPGNYVFNDAVQVALGSANLADCALTVLASVVSKRRDRDGRERIFLDAGRKVLTTDTGYGTNGFGILLHSPQTMKPLPHVRVAKLSEEHAWLEVAGGSTLEVGDRVRIVPNHACVVVNTQDALVLVDGEDVIASWTVDARGRST